MVMMMMLRKKERKETNTNTSRLILILAANTIWNHRGPWKTCKISSLKIHVSACHGTGNTRNVDSCPDVTDIRELEQPEILKTALSSAWSSLATSVLVSGKT